MPADTAGLEKTGYQSWLEKLRLHTLLTQMKNVRTGIVKAAMNALNF